MAKNNRKVSIDNDWRNLLYTELKRTGGDPSFLFEILEGIIQQRAWETLLDDNGQPVGSLRRLIEAPLPVGCGQKAEKVLRLLHIEHRYEDAGTQWKERMETLRQQVEAELGRDIQAAATQGRPPKNVIHNLLNSKPSQRGTSREHRIKVLKRDAPDIAERVITGEIAAAAGMRELDKRNGKPGALRRSVNMLSAASTLEGLLKYMPEDVLLELIDLLNEWRNEGGQ